MIIASIARVRLRMIVLKDVCRSSVSRCHVRQSIIARRAAVLTMVLMRRSNLWQAVEMKAAATPLLRRWDEKVIVQRQDVRMSIAIRQARQCTGQTMVRVQRPVETGIMTIPARVLKVSALRVGAMIIIRVMAGTVRLDRRLVC
ncbi:MAG: hypothetical protein V4662_09625 [Verrucomicrobiota bacterium]